MKSVLLRVMAAMSIFACGGVLAATAVPTQSPTITGKIVNSQGKAVAGASVYVFRMSSMWISDGPVATVKADKNGKFSYSPKTVDGTGSNLTFAAWAPGYACTGDERIGGNGPIDIVLSPESRIKGKVVDEKGKPLAGVTIAVVAQISHDQDRMYMLPGPIPGKMTAQTAKDGSFVIRGIPDPVATPQFQAYLRVSGKGRAGSIRVLSGSEIARGPKVVASPACTLEGSLSMPPGSGPLPKDTKLDIMVEGKQEYYMRQLEIGSDGRFKLSDLPPGKATVSLAYTPRRGAMPLDPPRWVLAKVGEPELKASQPTKLDLALCKGAVLKGLVTDKSTGEPAPGATVSFAPKDGPKYVRQWSAIADDKGRFEWRVSPGTVKVSLTGVRNQFLGQNGPSVELTVADGDEKTDIALVYDAAQARTYDSGRPAPIPADFELKPGEYDLTWDPALDCSGSMSSRVVREGARVGSLIRKAPVLHSKNAYRAALALDGTDDKGLLPIIVDEGRGTGKGFDIAYIDVNRNGDLTDDRPMNLSARDRSSYLATDPVTIQARQGKAASEVSNPVQVGLSLYVQNKRVVYCSLSRRGAWKGTIDTSKGKVEFAVVDSNSNGAYGELAQWDEKDEGMGEGDQFFVDANGAGHVSLDYWNGHRFGLYPVTRVGSKFYLITINDVGNHVTVQPYAGPMGQLLVRGTDINGAKAEAVSVSVFGRQGSYEFEDVKGQPVTIPAGEYRVNDCQMVVSSQNGGKLPITCTLREPLEVQADKAATLDISGKVTAKANPRDKELGWKSGSRGSLDWIIKIGDKVTVERMGSGSEYAPTVKFLDSKGKTLASTKGEFG